MALTYFAVTMPAGATLTSAFDLGSGDFTMYALVIPTFTTWNTTATCSVRLQGATGVSGTFYEVGYSNNPATSSTGFKAWEAGSDSTGKWVICEAAQFIRFGKISLSSTATVATEFLIVARQIR